MMKQQSEPIFHSPDNAGQSKTACKILPFRKPDSRRSAGNDEFGSARLAMEPADDCCPEEEKSFLSVCPMEHSNVIPCRAWVRGAEESSEGAFPSTHRWLKRVLLLGTFTAWTVAAIAISIALG